jgi:hypothetical protein
MRSLGGSRVEKKRCCRSSDILPSYQRFDLAAEQKPQIASHLASCAAELKLLSRHPAVEQLWEGMPPDDSALAAAILTEDSHKTEKLVCQIYRKDVLDLTLNRMNSWSAVC